MWPAVAGKIEPRTHDVCPVAAASVSATLLRGLRRALSRPGAITGEPVSRGIDKPCPPATIGQSSPLHHPPVRPGAVRGQRATVAPQWRNWQGWHRPVPLALLALTALAAAARKRASVASSLSPSRSPTSGGFWSASSGAPSRLRTESVPGRAGAVTTSGSLRNLTASVA